MLENTLPVTFMEYALAPDSGTVLRAAAARAAARGNLTNSNTCSLSNHPHPDRSPDGASRRDGVEGSLGSTRNWPPLG